MTILLVDPDPTSRSSLERSLERWGYRVLLAESEGEARTIVRSRTPDLILSGLPVAGRMGVEFLRSLQEGRPGRRILLLTGRHEVEATVEAMKAGVSDVLTKPVDRARLKSVIERTLASGIASHDPPAAKANGAPHPTHGRTKERAREPVESDVGFGRFVGRSEPMLEVYSLLGMVGASDAAVLITGETGTGKELAARTIHDLSARSSAPFVALNGAAIPQDLVESELFGHEEGSFTGANRNRKGCFEMADGGTLFLDEVSEMTPSLQPKLLRVLDEARFRRVGGRKEMRTNVRIISATNRDPRTAVEDGSMREDLYHRLNVFPIHLPPLRERRGDVDLLARVMLERSRRKLGVSGEAIGEECAGLLDRYCWPGNVRELRNVMERAAHLAGSGPVEARHLPQHLRDDEEPGDFLQRLPSGLTAAELERRLILQTLEDTGNNKAEAARRLDLDVKTIRNKLKKYRN